MAFSRTVIFFCGALLTAAATAAIAKDLTTYVQLANVTAVAASASGQRGTVPVTVVLHVANVATANDTCRNLPAVRAAIMSASSRSPIPFAQGRFDSDGVSNVIAGEIETAARLKGIVRIGFIYGTPKDTSDTATDVIDPGDVTGQKQTIKSGTSGKSAPCRRIAEPPRDLGWTTVKVQETKDKNMTPRAPPLRDPATQTQSKPGPAFETHPQFAPKK
ncbi:MAG: hypothetical protein FJ311_10300 [Rhodospirillales bacterium]|nr:hypothetical protein [Rhodospirillales bacterium]